MNSKTGLQVLGETSVTLLDSGNEVVTLDDAKLALQAEQKVAQADRLERHRMDLIFIKGMIISFDNGDGAIVRRMMSDWRDELEKNIAELKRDYNK